VATGDVVRVPPMRLAEPSTAPAAPAREFPVLFEDEHLLAIAKPAGVAVHGGSGVSFGRHRATAPGPAAGAVPGTRAPARQGDLGRAAAGQEAQRADGAAGPVRARDTGKVYRRWSSAPGRDSLKVIDLAAAQDAGRRRRAPCARRVARPRRRPALDHAGPVVRALRRGLTLLDVTIKTGRTHQIRVHLAHSGHPIVGDPKYGDFARNKRLARGPALRAHVPARARTGLRPPGQRRAHHPARQPAGECECADTPAPMTRPRRFDLIAFDWDGTLFDSTA
jgi:23S rRNA pseudouridine955/2504/2580 synthase